MIYLTVYHLPKNLLSSLPGLKQVEKRLCELSHSGDQYTLQYSKPVTAGGKRLRPALVLLCGSFGSAARSLLTDVACAAELIHAASLIHDDVIDHAAFRRGMPTISSRWGNHRAVLYGDFLFARAFYLLTKHGMATVLNNMTRAISLMCEGEIIQSNLLYDCSLTEAQYFSYIYKKTAYFIAACCLSGAQAGGLSPQHAELLANFGLRIGFAFQLTDDLLDFQGDEKSLGKQPLQDLREGYLTWPVIKLLKSPDYGDKTRQIIEKRHFTPENTSFICQALNDSGIIRETREQARRLIVRAKNVLKPLPARPARFILARIADFIVQRSC